MKKILKFAPPLVPLVLSGKKNSTWRLWDDKNITEGDLFDFLDSNTKQKFAEARIIKIVEKPIGELTEDDKKGHESFRTDKEMYKTYTKYYGKEVTSNTPIKIIWFELL